MILGKGYLDQHCNNGFSYIFSLYILRQYLTASPCFI